MIDISILNKSLMTQFIRMNFKLIEGKEFFEYI